MIPVELYEGYALEYLYYDEEFNVMRDVEDEVVFDLWYYITPYQFQKLKELKQQGRIRYVSMGKNGGCWADVSTGIHQDKQTKKTDGQI